MTDYPALIIKYKNDELSTIEDINKLGHNDLALFIFYVASSSQHDKAYFKFLPHVLNTFDLFTETNQVSFLSTLAPLCESASPSTSLKLLKLLEAMLYESRFNKLHDSSQLIFDSLTHIFASSHRIANVTRHFDTLTESAERYLSTRSLSVNDLAILALVKGSALINKIIQSMIEMTKISSFNCLRVIFKRSDYASVEIDSTMIDRASKRLSPHSFISLVNALPLSATENLNINLAELCLLALLESTKIDESVRFFLSRNSSQKFADSFSKAIVRNSVKCAQKVELLLSLCSKGETVPSDTLRALARISKTPNALRLLALIGCHVQCNMTDIFSATMTVPSPTSTKESFEIFNLTVACATAYGVALSQQLVTSIQKGASTHLSGAKAVIGMRAIDNNITTAVCAAVAATKGKYDSISTISNLLTVSSSLDSQLYRETYELVLSETASLKAFIATSESSSALLDSALRAKKNELDDDDIINLVLLYHSKPLPIEISESSMKYARDMVIAMPTSIKRSGALGHLVSQNTLDSNLVESIFEGLFSKLPFSLTEQEKICYNSTGRSTVQWDVSDEFKSLESIFESQLAKLDRAAVKDPKTRIERDRFKTTFVPSQVKEDLRLAQDERTRQNVNNRIEDIRQEISYLSAFLGSSPSIVPYYDIFVEKLIPLFDTTLAEDVSGLFTKICVKSRVFSSSHSGIENALPVALAKKDPYAINAVLDMISNMVSVSPIAAAEFGMVWPFIRECLSSTSFTTVKKVTHLLTEQLSDRYSEHGYLIYKLDAEAASKLPIIEILKCILNSQAPGLVELEVALESIMKSLGSIFESLDDSKTVIASIGLEDFACTNDETRILPVFTLLANTTYTSDKLSLISSFAKTLDNDEINKYVSVIDTNSKENKYTMTPGSVVQFLKPLICSSASNLAGIALSNYVIEGNAREIVSEIINLYTSFNFSTFDRDMGREREMHVIARANIISIFSTFTHVEASRFFVQDGEMSVLKDQKNFQTTLKVIAQFSEITSEEAIDIFTEHLAADKNNSSQIILLGGLARLIRRSHRNSEALLPQLCEKLKCDNFEILRASANALTCLCSSASRLPEFPPIDTIPSSYEEFFYVAYGNAALCAYHGISSLIENNLVSLLEKLSSSKIEIERSYCSILINAMIDNFGTLLEPFAPVILSLCSPMLADPSERVKTCTALALNKISASLSRFGVKYVAPSLIQSIESFKHKVQCGALSTIRSFATENPQALALAINDLLPIMQKTLSDPNEQTRKTALLALEDVCDTIKNSTIRKHISLIFTNPEQAILVLSKEIFSEQVDIVSQAVVLPMLCAGLNSLRDTVCLQTCLLISTIARLSHPSDLKTLQQRVSDAVLKIVFRATSDATRDASCEALAAIMPDLSRDLSLIDSLLSPKLSDISMSIRLGAARLISYFIADNQQLLSSFVDIILHEQYKDKYHLHGLILVFDYTALRVPEAFDAIVYCNALSALFPCLNAHDNFIKKDANRIAQTLIRSFSTKYTLQTAQKLFSTFVDEDEDLRYSVLTLLEQTVIKVQNASIEPETEKSLLSIAYLGTCDISYVNRTLALQIYRSLNGKHKVSIFSDELYSVASNYLAHFDNNDDSIEDFWTTISIFGRVLLSLNITKEDKLLSIVTTLFNSQLLNLALHYQLALLADYMRQKDVTRQLQIFLEKALSSNDETLVNTAVSTLMDILVTKTSFTEVILGVLSTVSPVGLQAVLRRYPNAGPSILPRLLVVPVSPDASRSLLILSEVSHDFFENSLDNIFDAMTQSLYSQESMNGLDLTYMAPLFRRCVTCYNPALVKAKVRLFTGRYESECFNVQKNIVEILTHYCSFPQCMSELLVFDFNLLLRGLVGTKELMNVCTSKLNSLSAPLQDDTKVYAECLTLLSRQPMENLAPPVSNQLVNFITNGLNVCPLEAILALENTVLSLMSGPVNAPIIQQLLGRVISMFNIIKQEDVSLKLMDLTVILLRSGLPQQTQIFAIPLISVATRCFSIKYRKEHLFHLGNLLVAIFEVITQPSFMIKSLVAKIDSLDERREVVRHCMIMAPLFPVLPIKDLCDLTTPLFKKCAEHEVSIGTEMGPSVSQRSDINDYTQFVLSLQDDSIEMLECILGYLWHVYVSHASVCNKETRRLIVVYLTDNVSFSGAANQDQLAKALEIWLDIDPKSEELKSIAGNITGGSVFVRKAVRKILE